MILNVLVWRIVKVGLAWGDHTHLNTLLCILWLQFLPTRICLIIYLICWQKLVISLFVLLPLEMVTSSHWVILDGVFLISMDLTLINRFYIKSHSLLPCQLIFLQSLRSLFKTKLWFLPVRLALLLLQLQTVKHIVFMSWTHFNLGLFLGRTVLLTIPFAIDRYSCPLMPFVERSINLAKPISKSVKLSLLIVFMVLHLGNNLILVGGGFKRRNLPISLFSMILMHWARLVNRVNSFWILKCYRIFLWIFWRLCEIVWRLDRNLLVKGVLFFPWKLWKSNFYKISIVHISPMISKSSHGCHRFCSFGLP